jgi:AraC-like DNA-binding protein
MDGIASLYLGSDWLLYVDSSARYKASEMVAPCLLLAQPGGALDIRGDNGRALCASTVLHAPNVVSSEDSARHGAAFLYLDPLSDAGHAVAHGCRAQGVRSWALPAGCDWSPPWFEALVNGRAHRADVARWVAQAQHALGALACEGEGARVDRRLHTVANAVAADAAGRLSIAQLATQVHWSDEHLRKVFRECVGITLSRYQMWCRIHRLLSSSCGPSSDARSTLEDAGFYDLPHGHRALRRYFGLSAGATLQPAIRRADCRAFGTRNGRGSSPFRTAVEQGPLLR